MDSHDSYFLNLRRTVKYILEHADKYEWSIQGLGMLRFYFSKELRLHVWSSLAHAPDVSDIHTHPWDFESTIISGYLYNHMYKVIDSPKHYFVQNLKCGEGAHLKEEPTLIGLKEYIWEEYGVGDTYSQYAAEIHKSEPIEGTVTLVERKFVNSDEDTASVFWYSDRKFGSAEPRKATPQEVKVITEIALNNWR